MAGHEPAGDTSGPSLLRRLLWQGNRHARPVRQKQRDSLAGSRALHSEFGFAFGSDRGVLTMLPEKLAPDEKRCPTWRRLTAALREDQ